MRKSEGAATPMQMDFNKLDFLLGNEDILKSMPTVPVMPLFSDYVIEFLDRVSKELMGYPNARDYSDVIAFAFWIRKASIIQIANNYPDRNRPIGKGIVFQIAPSNIPVQFAVALVYAMVAGNASIIRVSSKDFPQVRIICDCIQKVLDSDFGRMIPYICVLRYDHDDVITKELTEICDARMIWGGDQTIMNIRRVAPVSPRSIDIGFADRYSISIINAEAYLEKDAEVIATDFYNETYFLDQNACSSPRMVLWMGKQVDEAKERFWKTLGEHVENRYDMVPMSSSDKLLNIAVCAAEYPDIKVVKNDNLLIRIEMPELYVDIMDYKGNSGFFFEHTIKSLDEIAPLLKKECQTITFIGDLEDGIREQIRKTGVRGADRIVPMGHGADISFVWDGLDLPIMLSRKISNN